MRKSNRQILLASLSVAALAVGGAACQSGGGDVNAHNINVTINVPKTLITSASGIGVVYVGLYSGIDNTKGYPSPVTAPAASSVGDDAFPFGGASVGNFENRDARLVCQRVANQTVVDRGDHWELKATVYQFPWVKGQNVWAFTDRYNAALFQNGDAIDNPFTKAYPTCDPDNGYSDNYGFPIDITAITQTSETTAFTTPGPYWKVQFAPTELFDPNNGNKRLFGAADPVEILDGGGQFYPALVDPATNDTAFDVSNFTMIVATPVGTSLFPKATGGTPTRIENPAIGQSYGTQHEDILNFPSKYIVSGDLVVSTPAILNSPSDVTITLDTPVP